MQFFCLKCFHNCDVMLDLLMISGFPCRTESFHDYFKMTLCTCVLGNESWSRLLNYGYPVIFWYFFVEQLTRNRSFSVFLLFVLNLSHAVICWLGYAVPIFLFNHFLSTTETCGDYPEFQILDCFVSLLSFCSSTGCFPSTFYLCHFHFNLFLLMGFN